MLRQYMLLKSRNRAGDSEAEEGTDHSPGGPSLSTADPPIQHKLSEIIANLGVNHQRRHRQRLIRETKHTTVSETHPVKQWAYMNRILRQRNGSRNRAMRFISSR